MDLRRLSLRSARPLLDASSTQVIARSAVGRSDDRADVAWPHSPWLSAGEDDPVGCVGEYDWRLARIGQEMNASGGFTGADGLTRMVQTLKDAILSGDDVGLRPEHPMKGARLRSGEVQSGIEHAPMLQNVENTSAAKRERITIDRPAACHFRADASQSSRNSGSDAGPRVAEVVELHVDGRAKGKHRVEIALLLKRVLRRLNERARHNVERAPAGMQTEEGVGA